MTPTNTPLPDLKPCPFCGCDAWIIEDRGDHGTEPLLYRVQCKMCGASRGGCTYRDNAVLAWNLRAPDEALIAKVEALEGKEEGSAGSDLSPASRSQTPLSAGWQDISTAPKNRTPILAKFRDDIYPGIRPGRDDLEPWNGAWVVIHHPGVMADGFDIGWSVSAPVGNGGFPDEWIEGWAPLPPAESGPSGAQRSELTPQAPDSPKSNEAEQ